MARTPKTQQSPDDQHKAPTAKTKKPNNGRVYDPKRHLQYSSDPEVIQREIAEYSAQYPWYAAIVRVVMSELDRRGTVHEYSCFSPQRRTTNAS